MWVCLLNKPAITSGIILLDIYSLKLNIVFLNIKCKAVRINYRVNSGGHLLWHANEETWFRIRHLWNTGGNNTLKEQGICPVFVTC